MMEIKLLTREETAEFLKVSTRTIDRLKLPKTYVGRSPRYFLDDIMTYLKNNISTVQTSLQSLQPSRRQKRVTAILPKNQSNSDWMKSKMRQLKNA